MAESTLPPLSITGNPTGDEIAAIMAAYSLFVSQHGGNSVDNNLLSSRLWERAERIDLTEISALTGKMSSWSLTNRIRSRR